MSQDESKKPKPIRILSLDGGGIRGLSSLAVLERLEKTIGKPVRDQFDLICGTSTGGIIALAMTCKIFDPDNQFTSDRTEAEKRLGPTPFKPREMMKFYSTFASDVFAWGNMRYVSRTWGKGKYSSSKLEELLQKHFGKSTYLNQGESMPKTNAFCVSTAFAGDPYMFRSYPLKTKKPAAAIEIWKACRSTSAAPTYFDPFFVPSAADETYLTKDWIEDKAREGSVPETVKVCDGGVSFNNPTGLAIAEAKRLWPDRPIGLVVSVGTGKSAHVDPGVWYSGTGAFLVSAVSSSRTMHAMVKQFSKSLEFGYVRFNGPESVGKQGLDETDPTKLKLMVTDTEAMLDAPKGQQKLEKFKTIWHAIENGSFQPPKRL